MLFLMNRDEIIAVFEKKDSSYLLLGNKKEKMPIGFQTLENWLKPQRISVLSPGKMRLQ